MSFGIDIGNERHTRFNAGESTTGFAGRLKKAAEVSPVSVSVSATWDDGTYSLSVEADSERATVRDVEPDDLAETIARLIHRVTEAVRADALGKHRQRASSPLNLGLGTPRSGRENLRFGG